MNNVKKIVILLCAVFLLSFALCSASHATWYRNARFGYALDVPEEFEWLPEAANGDGRRFVCVSPAGEFSAWASFNALSQTLKQAADFAAEGRTIAYRRVNAKEGWFVLSWLDEEGRIVYRRDWLRDGTFYAVMFVYPKSSQKFFDGVIKRVTRSFSF